LGKQRNERKPDLGPFVLSCSSKKERKKDASEDRSILTPMPKNGRKIKHVFHASSIFRHRCSARSWRGIKAEPIKRKKGSSEEPPFVLQSTQEGWQIRCAYEQMICEEKRNRDFAFPWS
jgi:hypothetical protein